jgi:predicted nucleotidyltransferase component of viral defense system
MSELHLLPPEERRLFFAEAEIALGIPFAIIEKDYWVVWTLERLFSLSELKPHLTFKGGTSLSKVYGLIQRFSEDIDVSIEKDFLGYDKINDPEKADSKKKQKAAIDALSKSCSDYIQTNLLKNLKASITHRLGTQEGWQLMIDTQDPDGQTLQFKYPNITPRGGYISQSVKIELGARSEHWPVSNHKIQSYAKDALKEKITEDAVTVRVLNAERTFWEKATILHQYAYIPADKKLPPRISRHLYDFFQLLNSPIKNKAVLDTNLLDRVAKHKSIYFASAWANYGTAKKGTLKLSPSPRTLKELERDYAAMESMFFGEIPNWQLILKTIDQFEQEFNR